MKSKGEKKKARAIRVDELWCKRCGICVEFCPSKVFSNASPEFPIVTGLENCTVCRICEMRCPDYALSVEESGAS